MTKLAKEVDVVDGGSMTRLATEPFVLANVGDSPIDTYTVATVPDAASVSVDTIIFISDAPAGKEYAISDGTHWRFTEPGSINTFSGLTGYDSMILDHPNVVSYWPLDGNLNDLSPGNVDLTPGAVGHDVFTDGSAEPDGRAAFDNTPGNRRLVGGAIHAFPSSSFTIEFMAKVLSHPSQSNTFVARYGAGDNGWAIFDMGNGITAWRYGGGSAFDNWSANANDDVGGGYHLYAYKFDYAAHQASIFKDGTILAGPHASNGDTPANPSNPFTVGANPATGVPAILGRVAVYNAAVSNADLLAHAEELGVI